MNKFEIIFPKHFPSSIFIRPKKEYVHFYAEVFLDNKRSIHYLDRSICGRYVLYLDDSFAENNNLNLKYFKISVLK